MELFDTYLDQKQLAPNSIKAYKTAYTKMLTILNIPIDVPDLNWVKKYKHNLEVLDEANLKISVEKQMIGLLSGLSSYIQHENSEPHMAYKAILTKCSNIQKDIGMDQVKNQQQSDKWISYEKLSDLILNYPFDDGLDGKLKRSLLIFLLYLPRRIGEISLIKVVYKPLKDGNPDIKDLKLDRVDEDFNYLVLSDDPTKCLLIFYNYKTVRSYGVQYIVLPPLIYPALMDYLKSRPDFKHGKFLPLFTKPDDGLAYPASSLTKVVTRSMAKISGKKLNPHLFRHVYISHYLSKKLSIKQKKDITDKLATSLQEGQLTYQKIE